VQQRVDGRPGGAHPPRSGGGRGHVQHAAAAQGVTRAGGGAGAGGQQNNKALPTVLMRGRIINQTGQGLVIIEVNKQILALKQGSTLSLSGEFSHLSLQLSELTKESATIEVLPLKQTLRLQ
jgi:hypothetical protein